MTRTISHALTGNDELVGHGANPRETPSLPHAAEVEPPHGGEVEELEGVEGGALGVGAAGHHDPRAAVQIRLDT